jgi:hypothetical protein
MRGATYANDIANIAGLRSVWLPPAVMARTRVLDGHSPEKACDSIDERVADILSLPFSADSPDHGDAYA